MKLTNNVAFGGGKFYLALKKCISKFLIKVLEMLVNVKNFVMPFFPRRIVEPLLGREPISILSPQIYHPKPLDVLQIHWNFLDKIELVIHPIRVLPLHNVICKNRWGVLMTWITHTTCKQSPVLWQTPSCQVWYPLEL